MYSRVFMSPIAVMTAFYRKVNPINVAFQQKNTEDKNWYYCKNPLWLWGTCTYKEIDLDLDDYWLM